MHLFTAESQEKLNDIWDGHLSHEHAEHAIRFMTDVEHGHEDHYRWTQLQTETDRRVYHLPWTLDLVNAFHDADFEDQDPWQLP